MCASVTTTLASPEGSIFTTWCLKNRFLKVNPYDFSELLPAMKCFIFTQKNFYVFVNLAKPESVTHLNCAVYVVLYIKTPITKIYFIPILTANQIYIKQNKIIKKYTL